jgi:hypothetical protein
MKQLLNIRAYKCVESKQNYYSDNKLHESSCSIDKIVITFLKPNPSNQK